MKEFIKKHPIIANISLILAAIIFLVFSSLIFLDIWTHHGETSTVPPVKGLDYAQAVRELREADLTVEISDSIYDRTARPGTVVDSWPRAGAIVKRGRQVYVTITAFSPKMVTISMPVTGVSSRQAISYLEGLGITSIRTVSVPSQYPDLVENAYADNKSLSVGTNIPVTASVTLEVGAIPIYTAETDSLDFAIGEEIENIEFDE